MNLITCPTKSLSTYVGELYKGDNLADQLLAKSISLTVLPVFLTIELIFLRLPQFLTLRFTSDLDTQNKCIAKIQKLAFSIFQTPIAASNPLIILQRFMPLQHQQQLVYKDVSLLKWASNEFKNDKELMLKLVQKEAKALQFVSEELKGNHEFVLAAVKKNNCAFEFAPEELKRDYHIVLASTNITCG